MEGEREQETGAYAYSTNEEDYIGTFATREEAMDEGQEYAADDESTAFWTGRCVPYSPTIDGGDMIDRLREAAYDDLREHAVGWLDRVTREQEQDLTRRLTDALAAWMAEHGHEPSFYGVADVVEHKIDLAPTAPAPEVPCG